MKKWTMALISLFFIVICLPLQACQSVSGNNFLAQKLDVTPGKVVVSEKFTVSAEITNTSSREENYIVPVMVNGIADDRVTLTLSPGKSQEVKFTLSKFEPGTYEIKIGDKNSAVTVEKVVPAEFKLSDFNVNISEANPGEEVIITAQLYNTGGSEGTYIAELKINGTVEQSDKVILPAGVNYNCAFKLTKDEPGKYAVALGNLAGEFTVLEPVKAIQVATPVETPYQRKSQRPSSCCPSSDTGGDTSACL